MAKKTPAKAQKLPKREYDKVQALKEDYLQTVFNKKKLLNAWKGWERFRRFVGFLALLSLHSLGCQIQIRLQSFIQKTRYHNLT